MRGSKGRWALAALVAALVAFVAIGGPATAKRWINGADIKPGSISASKLSRRAKKALRGKPGPKGDAGAAGAAGPAGARGPAGALNVVDASGKALGMFAGWYSGSYYSIYTAQGALLFYEPSMSTDYPLPIAPPVLYYRTTDCTGTPYGVFAGYPVETAIIPSGGTPRPGNAIYVLVPGTLQSFTYESVLSGTCSASRSSTSSLLPAKAAGTVPTVQKPFALVPAS